MMQNMQLAPAVRVALYARVSTDEQKENYSLDSQLDILRKQAQDQGFVIVEEYIDGGYSGTSGDRPQLRRLLEDAERKKFDLVFVYKLDRFFRNTKDLLATVDRLSNWGVSLKSAMEPFESGTHIGRFMLSLLGIVAELDRATFLERSKQCKLRRYREGLYAGAPLFGYDYDPETGKLQIDEREAEIIRLIFLSYLEEDSSLVKVARRLRELGHRTMKGCEFASHTVHDILTDSIYAGRWYANKLGRNNALKPESEWILVRVPAIVSEDEFEDARRLLEQRKNHSRRNAKREYQLQGMVQCADCGATVAGTTDRQEKVIKNGKIYGPYEKTYYRCTHYSKNLYEKKTKCRLRYVRTEQLDETVWGEVEKLMINPTLVEKSIQCRDRLGNEEVRKYEAEIKQAEHGLERLTIEENRVFEAFKAGVIGIDRLKEETAKIEQSKAAMKSLVSDLESKLGSRSWKELKAEAVDYLEKVKAGISKFNLETKRRILRLLNTKVILNIDGNTDIFLNLPQAVTQPGIPFAHIELPPFA